MPTEYTVKAGESFTEMAARFGLSVDKLATLNNLIPVGKSLEVVELPVPVTTYKVRDGDTLLSIVLNSKVSIQDLMSWNRIVTSGQILNITGPAAPIPPVVVLPTSTPGKITPKQVLFTGKDAAGEGTTFCESVIRKGLALMKLPVTQEWVTGYLTIAARESSYNAMQWRINVSDSNAINPPGYTNASDGHPFQCSRGAWQCIPQTFAEYHQAGSSLSIYDPVANFCASVNYVRSQYGVNDSGSNLASKVQQADPNRSPKGY